MRTIKNAHSERPASVKAASNCPTYYLLSRREKYVWGLKPSPRRMAEFLTDKLVVSYRETHSFLPTNSASVSHHSSSRSHQTPPNSISVSILAQDTADSKLH